MPLRRQALFGAPHPSSPKVVAQLFALPDDRLQNEPNVKARNQPLPTRLRAQTRHPLFAPAQPEQGLYAGQHPFDSLEASCRSRCRAAPFQYVCGADGVSYTSHCACACLGVRVVCATLCPCDLVTDGAVSSAGSNNALAMAQAVAIAKPTVKADGEQARMSTKVTFRCTVA